MTWFLFVLVFSSSGYRVDAQHSMPDLATCERAAHTAQANIGSGDENESSAVFYCGTAREKAKG
jgi:hypothetical protein